MMKTTEQYINEYKRLSRPNQIDEKNYEKEIIKIFKNCDFYQFNFDQLLEIGFIRWDEENKLLLFPGIYYLCIKEGTKVYTINEKYEIFRKNGIDVDTGQGMLAFGILNEDLIEAKRQRREETIKKLEDGKT